MAPQALQCKRLLCPSTRASWGISDSHSAQKVTIKRTRISLPEDCLVLPSLRNPQHTGKVAKAMVEQARLPEQVAGSAKTRHDKK